ncbi:hypothetical protein QQG91_02205 [Marivivens sp. LCG002]|uniref:hypothetical protein n=1 Tax=Marivivens sp. LCG002 TaxID=3051171 RepID=UPI002556DB92|nr:hypothetical protein [Marivivens sp. LCG002]WIV51277.1 hypothetical protein QQG91_02205 [Marivivens sp. LCG002]
MAEEQATKVRLTLANRKVSDAGLALGLKPGDMLLAVNGRAFSEGVRSLNQRFAVARGRNLVLTFQRGTAVFMVLARTPALGSWVEEEGEPQFDGERQDPEMLTNWDILINEKGEYDLFPRKPSILAIACPPLWMLQARLWAPMAAITAAIVVAGLIWLPLGAVVWALAGLLLRHSGAQMVRADRLSLGMEPSAIVAAMNETQAHESYRLLNPEARFMFAPKMVEKENAEDETPA